MTTLAAGLDWTGLDWIGGCFSGVRSKEEEEGGGGGGGTTGDG